jgi:branched-subunit amino acid aminotransferase/4-amino-4-deoxychorismate lyase
MNEPLVYLNGELVPASQARLSIFDAGVVQGATVTEMTRTFHRRPFRLGDHLDRLFRSLRSARIDAGLSKEEFTAISQELIEHNARLIDDGDDLGLIQFVTAGEYPTYSRMDRSDRIHAVVAGSDPMNRVTTNSAPTVCVHTFPLPFVLWAKKMRAGAHLITPSIRQLPPQCLDPAMKCRSRMHYYLADKEVQQVDPDASALLLDLNARITETSTANFLMVERGAMISPPRTKILPGISRATVIDLAGKLSIPFVERDLTVSEAMNANEAFLSSTPYCLMPVTKLNGTIITQGRPGPLFRKLLDSWSQEVGLDIEQQIIDR